MKLDTAVVVFSLIRFSEYGKGDAVANETEETRKKKATRRSPRGPQRGAQIDQRERSLDQRSVQGEPTLTSTRPLTVRFSRRSEPKTSARAVQYRENNSSRRDRELSEKKERESPPPPHHLRGGHSGYAHHGQDFSKEKAQSSLVLVIGFRIQNPPGIRHTSHQTMARLSVA